MNRVCVFIAVLCLHLTSSVVADDGVQFFERRVRPLLVAACGECHGRKDPEGKLTLTTVAGLVAGGVSGPVLVPGQLQKSRLIQAVRYTARLKMPPEAKLSADEITILEQWVERGASVPGAGISTRTGNASGEMRITEEDRQWWAFQPVRDPLPPGVRQTDRLRTGVDAFVLHRLEAHGLGFSPDADRRILLRRVTFDLTGLPPTQEEAGAFLEDSRPDAFERLVDRLLASPQYGVRWGRHWLDVARYSDTNGGGFDYVYPAAWRYRDYVVGALNEDRPYDRFLVEQLAGDLLPIDCDAEEYTQRLTATGLLTLAPKGLGMQDKEQMVLDVVDDQIDVLGRSLMGLTLSCARCHDHKFDPIPTEDYYALAGIFHSTGCLTDQDKNPSYWPERPLELPRVTEARQAYQTRTAANSKAIAETRKTADAEVAAMARKRLPEYLLAATKIRQSAEWQTAVAHWTFDDSDSTAVKATRGPDGRLTNAGSPEGMRPVRTDGRPGTALRFSGRQDIVSIDGPTDGSLEFGTTTDFSVALWIRSAKGYSPRTADSLIAADYGAAMWFIALRPGAYNGIYLRHYDGKKTVDIQPAGNSLPTLTDNGWHHVVFTSERDGQGRVFLDGRKVGEVSIADVSRSARFTSPRFFRVGSVTNQFRGDIDDVAIWNRVLSPAEILRFFTQAGDPERGWNVSQVEQHTQSQKPAGTAFTDTDAAGQGLVPSLVRRFVRLLNEAEEDSASPVHSLVETPPDTVAQVQAFVNAGGNTLQKQLDDEKLKLFVPGTDAAEFYQDAAVQRLAALTAETLSIEKMRVPDPVMAMVASDTGQPGDLPVYIAGDLKNPGPVAYRGVPRLLSDRLTSAVDEGGRLTARQSTIPENRSGRLELARWLTSADHPLTARVFVNRVWLHHFGEGLVSTPDNFGRQGERPSHPELLDWLARRFMDSGWSIKSLHRQIVLSSTYRQSSRSGETSAESQTEHPAQSADAGNRLLWRMNRRRLEGEALRDAMLAVSGQLDRRLDGTVNQWKAKMFSVDDANAETANYNTFRRSLYLPVVRGAALHEMLQLFDFGDPNSIVARRDVTTVAPQALFLMNSPFVMEQAERLAQRLTGDTGFSVADRIRLAYRLALTRRPTVSEQARAVEFLGAGQPQDWRLFCQMLLCLNEFAFVE